ncbi:hypothetical protein C8R47DRAFT_1127033 [Mycena vitilis]|nr:hypothetical protein C8R47DRAFT_1127033 [Mycena vitilis]
MPTGLKSSILLLPPEIITAIFGHCLHPHCRDCSRTSLSGHEHCTTKGSWPSPSEAPLLLAQICHRWREICLDTPSLWAFIAFGDTGSIALLELWLSRARNRPLRIVLQTQDDARGELLVQVVQRHSSQWQEVHFTLSTSAYHRLAVTAFPLLKRLTLIAPGGHKYPIVILDSAPLLRYAEIVRLPHLTITHPWEQLTSLTFRAAVTPAEYIALLRYCPNLLDLHCGSTAGSAIVPPPLQLSFLRSLRLTDYSLMHCLTVPRLERLKLSHVTTDMDATANALQSLVARSRCDVHYLSIGTGLHFGMGDQSRRIFRAVNESILHLRLYSESAHELDAQIGVLRGVEVLPRLVRLIMRTTVVPADYAPLLSMLWSRRTDASCTLKSFELLLDSPLASGVPRAPAAGVSVMDHLQALSEAGLEAAIRRRVKGDVYRTLLSTARPDSDI